MKNTHETSRNSYVDVEKYDEVTGSWFEVDEYKSIGSAVSHVRTFGTDGLYRIRKVETIELEVVTVKPQFHTQTPSDLRSENEPTPSC